MKSSSWGNLRCLVPIFILSGIVALAQDQLPNPMFTAPADDALDHFLPLAQDQLYFDSSGQPINALPRTAKFAAQPSSISSYVIDANGILYAWGYNVDGEVGNNTHTNQPLPVIVPFPEGVTKWIGAAAGIAHALAIGNNGQLYAWGENEVGQLGDGSTTPRLKPHRVPLPTGVTGWQAVSAGFTHSLALADDGQLYAWGNNEDGELGLGYTNQNQRMPSRVVLPADVHSWRVIASGGSHNLALADVGKLYAWGYNAQGQLGNGTILDQSIPAPIRTPADVNGWKAIAAGNMHSLAITDSNRLYAWGNNRDGQLGTGEKLLFRVLPGLVSLPNSTAGFAGIAAGRAHSLALDTQGQLFSWGLNIQGQLGLGSYVTSFIPALMPFPAGVKAWVAITAGLDHSMAVGDNCQLYAWGRDYGGTLGTPTINSNMPTLVNSFVNLCAEISNLRPTVVMVSPANGASFTAPTNLLLQARALDRDGRISQVKFYLGDRLLGEGVRSQPDTNVFSLDLYQVTVGSYNLTAQALDNLGAAGVSQPVSVTLAKSVEFLTITSPTNGATFSAPASIDIEAEGVDPDGYFYAVEFYAGALRVGISAHETFVAPPPGTPSHHSFTWGSVPAGNYALTALAHDAAGKTIVSPIVHVTVKEPVESPWAIRHLPDAYTPGETLLVTIQAIPPDNAGAYGLEDRPPAGWTVSAVSHEGVFDALTGKVKLGPFFDNAARTITYSVTPRLNDTGAKEFAGLASADGVSQPVRGSNIIRRLEILRHPADRNPPNFVLSLDEITAYAGAWMKGKSWPVLPNPIPINYVTRAAALWRQGEGYRYEPAAGQPPTCWVSSNQVHVLGINARLRSSQPLDAGHNSVLCAITTGDSPGGAITVAITVKPAPGVLVYALEDQPPAGWTVTQINANGVWDPHHGRVKWLFLDGNARTLNYQAMPIAKTFGTFNFVGTAVLASAQAESSVVIAGQRQTWIKPEAVQPWTLAIHRPIGGGIRLAWSNATSQACLIETSTNLVDWELLTPNPSLLNPFEYDDLDSAVFDRRFYRLRPVAPE